MKKRFVTISALVAMSAGMLMAQDGATLFKKCAMCHGPNGEGKMVRKSQALTPPTF